MTQQFSELKLMTEEVNEIIEQLQKAVAALYTEEKSKHERKRKYKSANIQTANTDQANNNQE